MLNETNIGLNEFLNIYTEDRLDEFCSNNVELVCILDYSNHIDDCEDELMEIDSVFDELEIS